MRLVWLLWTDWEADSVRLVPKAKTKNRTQLWETVLELQSLKQGSLTPQDPVPVSMMFSSSLHLHASSDGELTTYGARPFYPWRALQVRKLALIGAKIHLPVSPTCLHQCCPLKPYSPLGVPRATGEVSTDTALSPHRLSSPSAWAAHSFTVPISLPSKPHHPE